MYVCWNVFMLAVILLDRHQQPHKQSSASTIGFERMHTDTDSAAPSLTSVYGVYGVFVLLAWGRALDRLWQVPINPILVRRVWCWKRSACVWDASCEAVLGVYFASLNPLKTSGAHFCMKGSGKSSWLRELFYYLSACITEKYCLHLAILHGDP